MNYNNIEIGRNGDLKALDMPVVIRPAYTQVQVIDSDTPHYPRTGYIAVCNPYNDHVYYMGKKYNPIQNSSVIDLAHKLIETSNQSPNPLRVERGSFRKGKTEIVLSTEEAVIDFNVQGIRYPTNYEVTIHNSYTGATSLSISAGGRLQICQNIFGLPTKIARGGIGVLGIKKRHSVNVLKTLEEAIKDIARLKGSFESMVGRKQWNVREESLIVKDLLELFPCENSQHKIPKAVIEERQLNDFVVPDFSYFMAATKIISHDKLLPTHKSRLEKFSRLLLSN